MLVHPEPACCILSYVSDRDANALMQPGVRGSDAFSAFFLSTFLVDTASAFLAKRLLGQVLA